MKELWATVATWIEMQTADKLGFCVYNDFFQIYIYIYIYGATVCSLAWFRFESILESKCVIIIMALRLETTRF